MQGASDRQARRYRAFISYSHRDAVAATRLHRRLEGYRVPGRLVGQPGPRGPVPARLAPIFRDLEDLPAADSLSAAVQAALAESDTLVVLCSPNAAASPWVAREIELFRALHPDRPVLAALLEGLPAAAFPAPLTAGGVEPLAADLSGRGSARRLGELKLIAGIAGVALDSLVQRDGQRQTRRVMVVTAAIFIFGLIMLAMSLVAFNARNEADRRRAEAQAQRAEAEGLVDFMLTDLRERLKPAGRLDLLDAANRRALAYFGGQDLRNLSPTALERRATALHNLAEDEANRRHLGHAAAAANEALRTTGALYAAAPRDPDRLFNHAQSVYWRAAMVEGRGDLGGAEAGYVEYDRLARRLLALAPAATRSLEEAGFGAGNRCNIGVLRRRADGLIAQCRRALDFLAAAAARKPGDIAAQLRVVNRLAWSADAEVIVGHPAAARRFRQQQEALLNELAKRFPDDVRVVDHQLGCQTNLAWLEYRAGERSAARARIRRAIVGITRLADNDPDNKVTAGRVQMMRDVERKML
ncbi:hypothetical protein IP88_11345 [alpha proteobacterium AAP81b]|nr:hypothetical protein IP88_11345 [alpha proteobacterium AAP81b]